MDTSILNGNGKRYEHCLPIWDASIIGDYNGEGLDSVESLDHDPGFGCVPTLVQRNIPDPPPVPDRRTAIQKKVDAENAAWFSLSETERNNIEDQFLKKNGI